MHDEPTAAPRTLSDALLWLNDRLGKTVSARIACERGDAEFMVFEAAGELRHWSSDLGDRVVIAYAHSREELAGYYKVGDAGLNLSDVRPSEVGNWPDADGLMVRLDVNTVLCLIEQEENADT